MKFAVIILSTATLKMKHSRVLLVYGHYALHFMDRKELYFWFGRLKLDGDDGGIYMIDLF